LRDKVQIATKVGLAWQDGAVFRDSRRARIRKEIEDSLRRLRTDVIDLYQVHWPDLETPIAETARILEDLRREGKIRAIGVSNYAPAQMNTFRAVAKLDAIQPPYLKGARDESRNRRRRCGRAATAMALALRARSGTDLGRPKSRTRQGSRDPTCTTGCPSRRRCAWRTATTAISQARAWRSSPPP
jgi:aryl-alcohol dehydrogenase-like predicted oxidoreductase